MTKLFEAMADIKLTTENIQKVIKMFPRDNDWKKLITKNRRDIDALRRGKDLPKKVEDELFNWALDNGEIKTDDVEELEDFIDSIMNEGTFEIAESVPKAVQGLNDLGNKMKGRDQKDIRRIEKLYRSGNKKVFQGAIRALDTDLRDQVKDIFDALGMVKQGVIESVDLTEGKMKEFHDMVKKGMTAEQISKKIGIDVKAIKDFMKDMGESTTDKKMLSVSDMNEKVMTLKQIAQKYKGDIAKAQKSGNSNSLKKAEKELLGWAAQHNEISGKDSTEADDWLSNVVADKDQFAALLKFAKD